ncbi:hypothetical protein DMP23_21085 [Amycolatopsis sp. A1MSW2902]
MSGHRHHPRTHRGDLSGEFAADSETDLFAPAHELGRHRQHRVDMSVRQVRQEQVIGHTIFYRT